MEAFILAAVLVLWIFVSSHILIEICNWVADNYGDGLALSFAVAGLVMIAVVSFAILTP